MLIKFNPYKRRDGQIMLYANAVDRRTSVGISESGVPAAYGKRTTPGQRKIIESLGAALASIEAKGGAIEAVPDYASHADDKARLGDFGDLYITDVATVGGIATGSDGAFLARDGKLYNLSIFAEIDA